MTIFHLEVVVGVSLLLVVLVLVLEVGCACACACACACCCCCCCCCNYLGVAVAAIVAVPLSITFAGQIPLPDARSLHTLYAFYATWILKLIGSLDWIFASNKSGFSQG